MEQDHILKSPVASAAPLQHISQDRFNQLRSGMPQSPSLPAYLNENSEPSSRRASELGAAADIKSKIAFFSSNQHGSTATNSFAIASSPTRSPVRSNFNSPSKGHSRANSVISIPTNAADVTALVEKLSAQLEQSRNRERLVAERVESLMEQLQTSHTRASQEQKYSDKEIKSMKKQVHKAELALIRCQADLEESRKEQEGLKVRVEHERQAKEKSRKEAFDRARTLASNVEELEVVKRERDLLLGENEALKSVQSSMHLAPRPQVQPDTREIGVQVQLEAEQKESTGKEKEVPSEPICQKCVELEFQPVQDTQHEAVQEIQEELDWVRSQLKREQDLVHFMNMQCQFRACPCRMADKAGVRFVHDYSYDHKQQELAKAKGTKRKAEDELPLPTYVTLRESLAQTSRERQDPEPKAPALPATPMNEVDAQLVRELNQDTGMDTDEDPTLRAVPISGTSSEDNTAGVISLDEAAEIPLPPSRDDDLEPTALLEDMTQVMVQPEPAATANHFNFSTSTSSRRPVEAETPQQRDTFSVDTNDDLFDIARPKHRLPPRPSTVMGIRTIDSPIRMVPLSPEHRNSLTPTTSPPRHRTMQIPLKDSPLKNAITHRRSQSRPRERSRARSPTPGRQIPDANSPSADTYFPVTPKQKMARQHRNLQLEMQSTAQLQALHTQSQPETQTQTTTTRVPVRGLDDDNMFNPLKSQSQDHAHTQPLNDDISTISRGRQPLSENDPNAPNTSTMLPGTPISREAALAQIRARRDRARSVAMRKQNDDENSSATRAKTPKSAARRGVMLSNREAIGMGRDISNLSQASAPARF